MIKNTVQLKDAQIEIDKQREESKELLDKKNIELEQKDEEIKNLQKKIEENDLALAEALANNAASS